jgi:hypothetical protein
MVMRRVQYRNIHPTTEDEILAWLDHDLLTKIAEYENRTPFSKFLVRTDNTLHIQKCWWGNLPEKADSTDVDRIIARGAFDTVAHGLDECEWLF